jgi:hypothetical protein
MLLAFAALMPLGALLARHKWLFGDKQAGGIKPSWFQGHRGIQITALLAALAGFIIALVRVVQAVLYCCCVCRRELICWIACMV